MDTFIQEYQNQPKNAISIDKVSDFNKYMQDGANSFNIFHTNIRGIAKNIDELYLYLSQLNNNFDIIVLTETFKITYKNIFGLKGYNTLYNESIFNKNDGVVAFIKNDIQFDQINVYH